MELYKAHPHKEKFFERLSIQMNPIEIQTGSGVSANRLSMVSQKKIFVQAGNRD